MVKVLFFSLLIQVFASYCKPVNNDATSIIAATEFVTIKNQKCNSNDPDIPGNDDSFEISYEDTGGIKHNLYLGKFYGTWRTYIDGQSDWGTVGEQGNPITSAACIGGANGDGYIEYTYENGKSTVEHQPKKPKPPRDCKRPTAWECSGVTLERGLAGYRNATIHPNGSKTRCHGSWEPTHFENNCN